MGVFSNWSPPDPFDGLSTQAARAALLRIREGLEDGQRYILRRAPRGNTRWAGTVLMEEGAEVSENAAKQILKTWVDEGMIYEEDYRNMVRRKDEKAVFVNMSMLPGEVSN